MHIVKSVGVMSAAKIMGLAYGCMGLIFAPLFLMIGMIGSLAKQSQVHFAGVLGIVLAIFMAIFYGVLGFIAGAIGALVYNLIAKWVGGLELELEIRTAALTAPYPNVPPPSASI